MATPVTDEDECDVFGCHGRAVRVDEDQSIGDADHHDCGKHLLELAQRHERIAERLRAALRDAGRLS